MAKKCVLPSKPKNIIKQPYLGAFVKEPVAGLYKWIADIDFSSLYPSIVKTFKLSAETLVGTVANYQEITLYLLAKHYNISDLKYVYDNLLPKYLNYGLLYYDNLEEVKSINKLGNDIKIDVSLHPIYKDEFESNFESLDEFIEWLKRRNYAFLPNGIIVDQNKDDAIIASVISDVMNSRTKYKKMMFEYAKKENEELEKNI